MQKFAIAIFAILVSFASHGADSSLCPAGEKTMFACSLGKKTVSICMNVGNGEIKPRLSYLFGDSKSIELSIPTTQTNQNTRTFFGRILYARGQTIYVRFENGSYEYIVYSNQGYSHRDLSDPNSIYSWLKEGVLVTSNNAVKANHPCKKSESPDSVLQNLDLSSQPMLAVINDPDFERVENILLSIDLDKALTLRSSGTPQKHGAP